VFEIRYARMPEDRGGEGVATTDALASAGQDQSSAASDSGSEAGPATESVRERRLRELQLQVND